MINNKFARILLAAVIALGMWLYVITVEVPEDEVTYNGITVTFQNETYLLEEKNMMVVTEDIPTVSLTLTGKRTDLNKLSSSNITAVVDLSQVNEAGTQRLTYKFSFPPDISPNAFEVMGSTPNSITLDIEKRSTKEVPVVVMYTGELPDDYMSDTSNLELSSKMVTIKGPSSVVDGISQAVIEVDLDGRVETIVETLEYKLCDSEGNPVDAKQIVTDIAEIELKLKIQKIKEVKLEMTVVDGGGATQNTSLVTIEPSVIKVSGRETVLNELPDVINIGTINLGDYAKDTSDLIYPINLPDNVTNLSNVTEAKVSVTFPDLAMKTLTITDITAATVPAGLAAELDTKALTVTIRGPKAKINAITEADISAIVDLSGAQAGSTSYTATIVMSTEFSGVGAMGTYSVTVTLRPGTGAAS